MSIFLIIGLVIFGVLALGATAFVVMAASRTPTLTMEDTKALAGGPNSGGPDVLSASISDVRSGGVVQAKDFGDEYEQCNLIIDSYNKMSAGTDVWHEAISEYKARPVAIEWQDSKGTTNYFIVTHHRMKLSKVGLSENDLGSPTKDLTATFDNMSYTYQRAGDGFFKKGESGFGKKFEYWIFEGEKNRALRVERIADGEFTASISRPANSDQFEVLKLRGA